MTIRTCNRNRALVRTLEEANRVTHTIQHNRRLKGSDFETFRSAAELKCLHPPPRKMNGSALAVDGSVICQLDESGTEGAG